MESEGTPLERVQIEYAQKFLTLYDTINGHLATYGRLQARHYVLEEVLQAMLHSMAATLPEGARAALAADLQARLQELSQRHATTNTGLQDNDSSSLGALMMMSLSPKK